MAAYYLHRGFGSPAPPLGPPPGMHVFRQMGSAGPALAAHSGPMKAETAGAGAASGGSNVGGAESVEPVKRKRGRPRKYGPDGTVSLALTPGEASEGPAQKRGRGRPPGSGRKQQLAALGEWVAGSAGVGFTPHVITVPIGEDVAAKIMSFSNQGPRAVSILSATGAVSTVTLLQPAVSGGTITYEGRFDILSLYGSYMLTDDGESRSRNGGLSIVLSSPDGRVVGGSIGGQLIAATAVQLVVGSFIYGRSKPKNKPKTDQEPGPESVPPIKDKESAPSNTPPIRRFNPTPMGVWPVSRQMEIRNPNVGIDLMQG